MDGKFTRKDRFFDNGHTTEPHASLTYSSVVSRYIVRISFTIADINDLDIWAWDIENTHLNPKSKKKIWKKSGTAFGNEKVKDMIVIRSLYGLKSSGSAWRSMIFETLLDLSYKPSRAYTDICMKPKTNPQTGKEYYAYVLLYLNSLIHLHHDP